MTLPSQVNNLKTDRAVKRDAQDNPRVGGYHGKLDTFYEHGNWWVTCIACGAQWDAVDTPHGFDFEEVTEGDEDAHARRWMVGGSRA